MSLHRAHSVRFKRCQSGPLAQRAKVTAPLSLAQQPYGAAAMVAGSAVAAIHMDMGAALEMTRHSIGIGKIAQRAAAHLHGPRQHSAYRRVQSAHPLGAHARSHCRGADARQKKNFRCVDVAHAYHQTPGQQQWLDRHPALFQSGLKSGQRKRVRQGLHSQSPEQFQRHRGLLVGCINDCTKPAWVVQPQGSAVGHQVEVIVYPCGRQPMAETQASRHAQMQQQKPGGWCPPAGTCRVCAGPAPAGPPGTWDHSPGASATVCPGRRPGCAHLLSHRRSCGASLPLRAIQAYTKSGKRFTGMYYHGPMALPQSIRLAALACAMTVVAYPALAQPTDDESRPATEAPPVASSPALDAKLFYEIFLGELTTRMGDPGAGYALMLEAARR